MENFTEFLENKSLEDLDIGSVPNLDIIKFIKQGERNIIIGRFRLKEEFAQLLLENHHKGLSRDIIFNAKALISNYAQKQLVKCYIKVPAAKKNAVGSIVFEEAYIILVATENILDEKQIIAVDKMVLTGEIPELPDIVAI